MVRLRDTNSRNPSHLKAQTAPIYPLRVRPPVYTRSSTAHPSDEYSTRGDSKKGRLAHAGVLRTPGRSKSRRSVLSAALRASGHNARMTKDSRRIAVGRKGGRRSGPKRTYNLLLKGGSDLQPEPG